MARTAIVVIAGNEWRRRRGALLLIGVLAGLFGGMVVGGAALVRRSSTAPDRLLDASGVGDAQVRVFQPELVEAMARLPMVAEVAQNAVAVGRVDGLGAVQFVGIVAPLSTSARLMHPVVVRGRAAARDSATEVMIIEDAAREGGYAVGDTLQLSMLTPEEMFQFDTGFGEPDGPKLALTITGVVRVPPGAFAGTPVLGTPALAARHPEMFSGIDAAFSLRRGPADLAAFSAAIDELVASTGSAVPDDDFAPATVTDPTEGTVVLKRSSNVLVGGLLAAVLAAAVAVVVALGQAWSRHHDASTPMQEIERALGLTSLERVAARALPAAATAAVAAAVTVLVALVGGVLEPPGALGGVEPDPGWRPDVLVALLGALAVAVAVMAAASVAVWSAGRRRGAAGVPGRRRFALALPQRHGWPLVGSVFALSRSAGTRRAPMRTSLLAAVIGVAGVIGALTFSASLDRLASEPARYGWTSDLAVVDVNDEMLAELLADDRLIAVADGTSANVSIDGRYVDAYSFEQRRGAIGWELLAGRAPAAADEMVAGTKLAERLGVVVGDQLMIGDRSAGTAVATTVVGVGIGPTLNGEAFAVHALFTTDGLARAQSVGNFREAFVRVAPGFDVDMVGAELGARFELSTQSMPPEVRDVVDLGSLPSLLGSFLAALALVAHAHGLMVTVRERREDLAVMRALGSTTRQLRLTLITASLAGAAVGVVVGVPLGWAVARLVWGRVATSLGVADDIVAPWTIAPAVLAVFAVAALLAVVPARRAVRAAPGQVLRGESMAL